MDVRRVHPGKAEIWFKRGQLLSSALFSLGHGGNDVKKVMGLIGPPVLVYLNTNGLHIEDVPGWLHVTMNEVAGKKKLHLPEWIPLACYSAIAIRHNEWWVENRQNYGNQNYKSYSD